MLAAKISAHTRMKTSRVKKAVNDGTTRGLYRTAGLVRTASKRSMRLRAGASQAGSPPHAHTRLGLRIINFVVDKQAKSALVGPIKFSGSNFLNEPVPHALEFGGSYLTPYGVSLYPQRSFMGHTLKKLHRAGLIHRNFSVSLARAF